MYNRCYIILLVFVLSLHACKDRNNTNGHEAATTTSPLSLNEMEQKLQTDSTASDSVREHLIERYMETGNTGKALFHIQHLLHKQPENPAYLYMMADALEKKGDTTQSIHYFEKAIESAGVFSEAELRLAFLYAETSNQNTIELCDNLLKQEGAFKMRSDILLIKGLYFGRIGNTDQALRVYNQIIREDYSYMDAYLEKGLIYYDQKKYQEAFNVFKLSTTIKNSFAEGYFWMAKTEEKLLQKEAAINNYKRALALDPSIIEAREGLKRLGIIK
jgi:tetratricopeptide (TPR) repeat protein